MTDSEVQTFLRSSPPHTGKLATTRKDGRPHVAPIWFAFDDDGSVVFTTGAETVKGVTMRRDPRVSLCIDDERPPFAFVILEGTVSFDDDLDGLLHWATVIGGRYMGVEQADAYGQRNAVPGELLVRLRPSRVTSARDVAL